MLASVLVACGSAPPPPPERPAAEATDAGAPSAELAADASSPTAVTSANAPAANDAKPAPVEAPAATAPVVKLLEPGEAPRQTLRYVFKKGASTTLELDTKVGMTAGQNGMRGPRVDVPPIRMRMRIDAADVTSDGDARLTWTVQTAEVLPQTGPAANEAMRSAVTHELASLAGMHGTALVSPRGVAKETDFELPAGADTAVRSRMDSMKDTIRQLYAPLPEEPVGKGGKWEVTMTLPMQGVAAKVLANYTLVEAKKDSAKVKTDAKIEAMPHQTMVLGDKLPPGATATLDSLTGSGQGTSDIAFQRLGNAGQSKMNVVVAYTVEMKGQRVQGSVDSDIALEMRPVTGKK